MPHREMPSQTDENYLRRLLSDWVISLDWSQNLVVVKTPPGCAHVVALAIDRAENAQILGTIAGDDTLLVIARDDAEQSVGWLRELADLNTE